MEKHTRKFSVRAFVTLMIAISGLGLPITGIATHMHGFEPLTVARHAWMSAHNCLGFLFVLFSIWHLAFNRRALWKYMKGAAAQVPLFSTEAFLACTAVAFLLVLFAGHAFHVGG